MSYIPFRICDTSFGLHLKTGVEDRVFVKTIGWPIDCLCIVSYGMEISFVMGNFIGIMNTRICKGFFGSAFGSVRTRNRLVWLHVWHYILRYKADFFQIHFCWWRRIYSLSLTPFSETYELRGYVVEGYQRYIPNLVMWHAECCCVMIIYWSFVDQSVALWKSVALWTRLRQTSLPGNGQNRNMQQGYEGRAL